MATFKRKELEENPFRPGYGQRPPFLAGRGPEQDALGTRVRGLAKQGSTRGFALYGPRGMGKTALLDWVKHEYGVGKWRRKVNVIRTTAALMLDSKESLLNTLLAEKTVPHQVETSIKGGVPPVAEGSVKTTEVAIDRRWADLPNTLIAACRKTPVVLLLDEAHAIGKIDGKLYQQFLHVAQDVAGESPFLLVLAGTPDLPNALNSVGSTFIDRAETLGIDLLEKDGAAQAIREPLANDGIHIADDALTVAAEDGQRYPFFLQLWGKALWNVAMTNGKARLTMEDVEADREAPQKEKFDYYAKRYAEISANKLTKAAARAVAHAFKNADSLYDGQLRELVEEAMPAHLPQEELSDNANSQYQILQHLGFIWSQPGEVIVRPGIPSLMDFTREIMHKEQASLSEAAE